VSDRSRAAEWVGTGALVTLAVCAAALTLSNVRRALFPSPVMLSQPVDSVPEWQGYAVGGTRVGPKGALVTLIIFSDYQCPVCRRLFLNVQLISRTFPDEVAVVWRHLPLENHSSALPAARASVCAGKERRFEAMHSQLFLMQDSLGVVSWTNLALRAGIVDTAAFSACLQTADTQARIDEDRAAARAVHAAATPTLLVNGLEYVGAPRDLARIVRYARRRAVQGI